MRIDLGNMVRDGTKVDVCSTNKRSLMISKQPQSIWSKKTTQPHRELQSMEDRMVDYLWQLVWTNGPNCMELLSLKSGTLIDFSRRIAINQKFLILWQSTRFTSLPKIHNRIRLVPWIRLFGWWKPNHFRKFVPPFPFAQCTFTRWWNRSVSVCSTHYCRPWWQSGAPPFIQTDCRAAIENRQGESSGESKFCLCETTTHWITVLFVEY